MGTNAIDGGRQHGGIGVSAMRVSRQFGRVDVLAAREMFEHVGGAVAHAA